MSRDMIDTSTSTSRYLARDLGPEGIRVNLVAAGPVKTTAAKSIPGFEAVEGGWDERAPLGWDVSDPEPTARAVAALLSDWFPATTGEIVHVDTATPIPPWMTRGNDPPGVGSENGSAVTG